MSVIARFANHVRALAAQWLGRRERRNPEAVYEAAIRERLNQYGKLREAAAGVLYLRGKLSRELEQRSQELQALGRQIDCAVDAADDDVAVTLIRRRDAVVADVGRLNGELGDLNKEAEAAKKNLILFGDQIARLKDEKVRMVARLANAKARLRLHETLNGLSPEADIQALEAVRDYVNRLSSEVQVSNELGDGELSRKLADIREAESLAAARAQLDELKRARPRKLLPLILSQNQAAPVS
jgi:phage shock protein A